MEAPQQSHEHVYATFLLHFNFAVFSLKHGKHSSTSPEIGLGNT